MSLSSLASSVLIALAWFLTAVLVALVVVVLIAWCLFHAWLRWTEWRDRKKRDAEIAWCRDWICPECQRPIGRDVDGERMRGVTSMDFRGNPFHSTSIITCPHCWLTNAFDANGLHLFEHGRFCDAEEYSRQLERWPRLARELNCPLCGTAYEDWSGVSCGDNTNPDPTYWRTGFRVRCPKCEAEAEVFEEPDGPRIVRIRVGEEWF